MPFSVPTLSTGYINVFLRFTSLHSLWTTLKATSMCVHFSNPLPLLCTLEVRAFSAFEVVYISNILFGFRLYAQKNESSVQGIIEHVLLSKLCWIGSSYGIDSLGEPNKSSICSGLVISTSICNRRKSFSVKCVFSLCLMVQILCFIIVSKYNSFSHNYSYTHYYNTVNERLNHPNNDIITTPTELKH